MVRILLVFLLLIPSGALAQDALTRASNLLKRLEYRKAHQMALRVERSANSGPRELIEAFRIQGLSLAARGKRKQATLAFRKLLAIDPDFRLSDDISPKLLPPFHQAVGAAERQGSIRLVHQQPDPPMTLAGLKLPVTLTANPMRLVRAVKIRYRLDDNEEEEVVFEVGRPRTVTVALPNPLEANRVSYWFAAVNRHGAELVRAGNREKPYTLTRAGPPPEPAAPPAGPKVLAVAPVPPPPPPEPVAPPGHKAEPERKQETPWYKTWWFWTTVGVVVAAGATTGVVLGLQDDGEPYRYDITIE